MQTCWFIVIEVGGRWWVDCEGKAYGPLASEQEALSDAVRIAQAYGDPARRSVVYAPDKAKRHVAIWSDPLQGADGA